MAYHKADITKGVVGKFSKIEEEFLELKDAWEQGNRILELCELSDLLGAMTQYVEQNFNLSLADLVKMMSATQRAFETGERR